MNGSRIVRVGNAQAFWGDRSDAACDLLAREPELDFLTLDYLAEVSLSILARQRERDPTAGYARDFLDVVRSLVPYWNAGGRCRLIANAGGLDPQACATACAKLLEEAGCRTLRIGVVSGDDVLSLIGGTTDPNRREWFRNLDSGRPITEVLNRVITANAYLGAAPIVEALDRGAEIVVTGRVADPSLTVAACVHHFGWSMEDWDRVAGATVAGHLIECGTQVTGGISTDWLDLPDPVHLGFPIAEIDDDGSCTITLPRGAGGRVTAATVKEQLLYEIGDPAKYQSPDATVSFLSLRLADLGGNRVRVTGASGSPPPATYKVSATYRDGYRAAGTLTVFGHHAVAKARRAGEIVLQRVAAAGYELRNAVVECLGSGDCVPGVLPEAAHDELVETVLRIAVEAESSEAVERFTRELMPLITAGPQGTTGYAEGRPRVHPVIRYWPCLIERDTVQARVEWLESGGPKAEVRNQWSEISDFRRSNPPVLNPQPSTPNPRPCTQTLRDLAYARSGDKGTNANIGVIARHAEAYAFLVQWLTAERVAAYFQPLGLTRVERFELENLEALNFVLHGVLANNLRNDAQGKVLGQALLEMKLDDSPDSH